MKKLREMLKNEKGFTLIELLAVIVILGIIAAIAIPAIGGVIDNTETDAHDANGLSLIESARLAEAQGLQKEAVGTGDALDGYSMSTLFANNYLDSIPQDPKGEGPYKSGYVEITEDEDGSLVYTVYLKGNNDEDVWSAPKTKNELSQ